jgi:hypothetical protein
MQRKKVNAEKKMQIKEERKCRRQEENVEKK